MSALHVRLRQRKQFNRRWKAYDQWEEWQVKNGKRVLSRHAHQDEANEVLRKKIIARRKTMMAEKPDTPTIDWRTRANKLESDLMWSGAAMEVALLYLKNGRPEDAMLTLQQRIDYVREELQKLLAE